MALPTSGKIRFPDDINTELGAPISTVRRFKDQAVLDLIGKTASDPIRLPDDFYGASAVPKLTVGVGVLDTTSKYYYGVNRYPITSTLQTFGSVSDAGVINGLGYPLWAIWVDVEKSTNKHFHSLQLDIGTVNDAAWQTVAPASMTLSTFRGSLTFSRGSKLSSFGRYRVTYTQTSAATYSPVILSASDNGNNVEVSFSF
jgi:hypothetical protein